MGQILWVSGISICSLVDLEVTLDRRVSVGLRGLDTIKFFMKRRMIKWFGASH